MTRSSSHKANSKPSKTKGRIITDLQESTIAPKSETTLTPAQQIIRDLSDRIVAAQKPIRILDAIKWGPEIKQAFFKNKFKRQPNIHADYYKARPLPFDPDAKKNEFFAIERDINRYLGQFSGVGGIMLRMCHEYRKAISMLRARGTSDFSKISMELYGSSMDAFYPGAPVLNDLYQLLRVPLLNLREAINGEMDQKKYSSTEGVTILKTHLADYFQDLAHQVTVMQRDDIIADAAAGASTLKLRQDAMFSDRDLKLLEVHEGWVHVGTSINGAAQPICTFLGKGAPSSTITQEGLAVITEIFTFSSYPERVQRITDRVRGINMAENGASFLEVFRYFKERGLHDEENYNLTSRIFRGSTPEEGPFTKDLSYAKGFILIYNYIRLAVQQNLLDHIPVLFVGKTTLEDLSVLVALIKEGTVVPPRFMPPQFKDLAALTSWMCFSLFMNTLNLEQLSANYKQILYA